jgi:hypothetical protein
MSAAGSQRSLRYILESSFGTTPSTPTLETIRNTGGSGVGLDRSQLQSNEFRSDRNVSNLRLGNKTPNLEIPIELSYESFEDLIASALFGEWQDTDSDTNPDTVKNGTTQKSLTIEEAFEDISVFQVARGMIVNSMSLNIQPDQIITGSFGFAGKAVDAPATTTIASSVNAPNTNPPFDSYTGSINEGGSQIAVVSGLSLSLNNGLDPKFPLFQNEAHHIGAGRCNVTAELSAYFTDKALLEKFVNETESTLEVVLTDPNGNSYTITLPRIKFTGESKNITENDIVQTLPIQALYDETEACAIKIHKTV